MPFPERVGWKGLDEVALFFSFSEQELSLDELILDEHVFRKELCETHLGKCVDDRPGDFAEFAGPAGQSDGRSAIVC